MGEIRTVDPKTLSFMRGPFTLDAYEPVMQESTYEGRPPWEVGMQLTLSNPEGGQFQVLLRKGGRNIIETLLYHRFCAMMNDNPEINSITFTWDNSKNQVIIASAHRKVDSTK